MALESWRVTFLRVGIPIRNHNIVWTIQSQKPLMGEPDFFPDAQNPAVLIVFYQPMRLGKNCFIPCSKIWPRLECWAMGSISIASMMRRRRLADCSA